MLDLPPCSGCRHFMTGVNGILKKFSKTTKADIQKELATMLKLHATCQCNGTPSHDDDKSESGSVHSNSDSFHVSKNGEENRPKEISLPTPTVPVIPQALPEIPPAPLSNAHPSGQQKSSVQNELDLSSIQSASAFSTPTGGFSSSTPRRSDPSMLKHPLRPLPNRPIDNVVICDSQGKDIIPVRMDPTSRTSVLTLRGATLSSIFVPHDVPPQMQVKTVVLFVGGNTIATYVRENEMSAGGIASKYLEDLEGLLHRLKPHYPRASFQITDILPRNDYSPALETLISDQLKDFCKNYLNMKLISFPNLNDRMFRKDGYHLDAVGLAYCCRAIKRSLQIPLGTSAPGNTEGIHRNTSPLLPRWNTPPLLPTPPLPGIVNTMQQRPSLLPPTAVWAQNQNFLQELIHLLVPAVAEKVRALLK